MELLLFYILGAIAVAAAVMAITRANPLATALWIVVSLLSIGGLMGLLGAPIVALLHILLAAGAIMVLFVFVIMLVPLDKHAMSRGIRFGKVVGAFAAAYLVAVIVVALFRAPLAGETAIDPSYTAPSTLGSLLVGTFAIPFELISVVLLLATVAAVVMGKKHI